jgi:hypothetical protein
MIVRREYANNNKSQPHRCDTFGTINIFFEMFPLIFSQIFDESGSLHLNRTSDEPQFSVQTLEPGKTYVIRITAFNAKGRSQTVSLTASTLKVAEKRMGECMKPKLSQQELTIRKSGDFYRAQEITIMH